MKLIRIWKWRAWSSLPPSFQNIILNRTKTLLWRRGRLMIKQRRRWSFKLTIHTKNFTSIYRRYQEWSKPSTSTTRWRNHHLIMISHRQRRQYESHLRSLPCSSQSMISYATTRLTRNVFTLFYQQEFPCIIGIAKQSFCIFFISKNLCIIQLF